MSKELTKVILEGALGERFGRKWELLVSSPSEALRLIDANVPGVFRWIRSKLGHLNYRVTVFYESGKQEDLDNETYPLRRKARVYRFVPVIEGAGGGVKMVLGAVLMAVAFWYLAPVSGTVLTATQAMVRQTVFSMGMGLFVNGAVELLTRTSVKDNTETKDKTSYQFGGPVNTTSQGVPVPLIYGTVLVGSQAISAKVTVDDI